MPPSPRRRRAKQLTPLPLAGMMARQGRMELYFSHSYRDVRINSYFVNELADCGFRLLADQKSPVWCVAKLERYITELPGFLSIIPRRQAEDGTITYSPYIGHELALARRSGVPRLLFVDDAVLARHRSRFPHDAVPFVADAPARDRRRHSEQIRVFRERLEQRAGRPSRRFVDRQATVVAASGKAIAQAADYVEDILTAKGFAVRMVRGRQDLAGFEDVGLFESLVASELCVFLLDTRLSAADVLMAMAYAHSIPSIRLQYDRTATACEPTLSGRLPWSRTADLVGEFEKQLDGFRSGFVEAVSLAENSSATEAVRSIGTTRWTPTPQQLWRYDDPAALRQHVSYLHPSVLDEVERVNRLHGTTLAARSERAQHLEICVELFRQLKRLHFAYELEPQSLSDGEQAIRTPGDIFGSRAATCIDIACLFASLLGAAGLSPVIVLLVKGADGHALVGYRAINAAEWPSSPTKGDLLAALDLQDLVLFEATGAVESEQPVGAETLDERRLGARTLDFATARQAAERLLRSDMQLQAAVDIAVP